MHPPARTFLGHPAGLATLFLTEMWERFSYYGMRALLIFYLTQHFLFPKEQAYLIYGGYTALAFLSPVVGGFVADRWLGARRAVIFGGVLLVCGHLGLAIEGEPARMAGDVVSRDGVRLDVFYASLALIVAGVGFLKANVSTLVGALYEHNDVRRDAGFTLFYLGINVGAALGALLAGALGQTFGWHYGFGAAGIGMLLGLIAFIRGMPLLQGHGGVPAGADLQRRVAKIPRGALVYFGGLGFVAVVWVLLQNVSAIGWLLGVGGAAVVGYIVLTSYTTLDRAQRQHIFAALSLMALSVLFWALYEQAGSSLNVFANERVNRVVLGLEIPAATFQSLPAIYVVLLAPLFAALWGRLAKHGRDLSGATKFALALMQLGLGFLVLVAGASWFAGELTPLAFLFLIYFLHTTGELCLSPVGLSAMSRLAPAHMVGLIMGTWFMAQAGGNFMSSLIARATSAGADAAGGTDRVLEVYTNVGLLAVVIGIAVLIVAPMLRRMSQD